MTTVIKTIIMIFVVLLPFMYLFSACTLPLLLFSHRCIHVMNALQQHMSTAGGHGGRASGGRGKPQAKTLSADSTTAVSGEADIAEGHDDGLLQGAALTEADSDKDMQDELPLAARLVEKQQRLLADQQMLAAARATDRRPSHSPDVVVPAQTLPASGKWQYMWFVTRTP